MLLTSDLDDNQRDLALKCADNGIPLEKAVQLAQNPEEMNEYLEIFISNKTESGLVHIPTGFVHLIVEGEQYYINLTAGQKGILLPISTQEGSYHVWGNYSGDGFWNSAVNTTDLILKT